MSSFAIYLVKKSPILVLKNFFGAFGARLHNDQLMVPVN